MLRVTLNGGHTQWIVPPNGWPQYPMVGWESVALLVPGSADTEVSLGFPPTYVNPSTGLEETNAFGDNSVWHTNFNGDVSLSAEIKGLSSHSAAWLDVPCVYTADDVAYNLVKPGDVFDNVGDYHRYHRVKYVGGLSEMYDFSKSVIMTTCGYLSSINTSLCQTTWGYVICGTQYVLLGPIVSSFYADSSTLNQAERDMESAMYEVMNTWGSQSPKAMIPVHFPHASSTPFTTTEALLDLDRLAQDLSQSTFIDEAELDSFSRISQTAIAGVKDDTGENLQTIFEFGKLITKALTPSGRIQLSDELSESFISLVKGFSDLSPSDVTKAASGIYLGSKWGTPLTVAEMKRLLTHLLTNFETVNFPVKKIRGRSDVPCHMAGCYNDVSVECTRSLLCYYETNDNRVPKLVKRLFDESILSFGNLYDFIPYSFVFDWLTNFGSAIETYDNLLYSAAFLNVRGTIRTECITWRVPGERLKNYRAFRHWDVSGDFVVKKYCRKLRDTLPLPTVTFSSDLSASHFFDGAVLILQRT